ncbi:MAG: DUF721 domain-containing protein [Spirochaetales bacterium]
MEKADRILSALFERLNISDSEGYVRLFSTWRSVCDEVSSRGLADHSVIIDVRHGTVIVAVDHPGWLQLIQMQEKRLLGKLQKRFPDMGLQAIHFYISRERVDFVQVADTVENESNERPQASIRAGSATQRGSSEENAVLDRISDANLRRSFERLREDLDNR